MSVSKRTLSKLPGLEIIPSTRVVIPLHKVLLDLVILIPQLIKHGKIIFLEVIWSIVNHIVG